MVCIKSTHIDGQTASGRIRDTPLCSVFPIETYVGSFVLSVAVLQIGDRHFSLCNLNTALNSPSRIGGFNLALPLSFAENNCAFVVYRCVTNDLFILTCYENDLVRVVRSLVLAGACTEMIRGSRITDHHAKRRTDHGSPVSVNSQTGVLS